MDFCCFALQTAPLVSKQRVRGVLDGCTSAREGCIGTCRCAVARAERARADDWYLLQKEKPQAALTMALLLVLALRGCWLRCARSMGCCVFRACSFCSCAGHARIFWFRAFRASGAVCTSSTVSVPAVRTFCPARVVSAVAALRPACALRTVRVSCTLPARAFCAANTFCLASSAFPVTFLTSAALRVSFFVRCGTNPFSTTFPQRNRLLTCARKSHARVICTSVRTSTRTPIRALTGAPTVGMFLQNIRIYLHCFKRKQRKLGMDKPLNLA